MKSYVKSTCVILTIVFGFGFTKGNQLTEAINQLKNCRTTDQYINMARSFTDLSKNEEYTWYPDYYSAYCYTLASYSSSDISIIDSLLDKAKFQLNRAEIKSPNNDEIECVKSMILSARIIVNPQERGYTYGVKSGKILESVLLKNPNNPRALLLVAQAKMYMPEEYGGGCKNTKPILDVATKKFIDFKKENNYSPDWGKSELDELIKRCN